MSRASADRPHSTSERRSGRSSRGGGRVGHWSGAYVRRPSWLAKSIRSAIRPYGCCKSGGFRRTTATHARPASGACAPEAIDSVIIASHFGLIFVDADGFLTGWIDPTAENPGVWDLHLMPGEPYP